MPGVPGKARRPGKQNEGNKGAKSKMRHAGKEGGWWGEWVEAVGPCGLLLRVRWEPLESFEQ